MIYIYIKMIEINSTKVCRSMHHWGRTNHSRCGRSVQYVKQTVVCYCRSIDMETLLQAFLLNFQDANMVPAVMQVQWQQMIHDLWSTQVPRHFDGRFFYLCLVIAQQTQSSPEQPKLHNYISSLCQEFRRLRLCSSRWGDMSGTGVHCFDQKMGTALIQHPETHTDRVESLLKHFPSLVNIWCLRKLAENKFRCTFQTPHNPATVPGIVSEQTKGSKNNLVDISASSSRYQTTWLVQEHCNMRGFLGLPSKRSSPNIFVLRTISFVGPHLQRHRHFQSWAAAKSSGTSAIALLSR